jgi:Na+-translocating ferredoxin:NAD+ oxidoreductase RNF subunit RnfB
MSEDEVYMLPSLITPNKPVEFDEKVCTGCNTCVEICRSDVLMPNPEKGKPPVILYPDECWYGGCCVAMCPLWEQGAIRMKHPLAQSVGWKRKETGEHFRIGMSNPPPPNLRPPVGGWRARA